MNTTIENLVVNWDSLFDAYVESYYKDKRSKSTGPLTVIEREDGRYQLVDGYHRLIEMLVLGVPQKTVAKLQLD